MTERVRRWPPLLAAAALACLLLHGSTARAGSLRVSGSVAVNYWGIEDRDIGKDQPAGMGLDASLTIGGDVHDDLSFSVKSCYSCHGIEPEHVTIDYQPSPRLNVQVGRLAVPFGDFSNRVDPGSRALPAAPLIYDMGGMAYGSRTAFNLGVTPLPYVDTGVLLYGQVWLGSRVQLWYGGYAVAGMRGGNDIDWVAMRSLYYTDNNDEPALGGRVTVTYSAEPGEALGDVSLGASATAGHYDAATKLAYRLWGADVTARVCKATVRAEYAQRRTDLDGDATGYPYVVVDPWFDKSGWYVELEHPLAQGLSAVARYDRLERRGVPLPGSAAELTPSSAIDRYSAGLTYAPASSTFVKLSYERWLAPDFGDFHSARASLGATF